MPEPHQAVQATIFAITTLRQDDSWRLRLTGEFDVASAAVARVAFEDVLKESGATVVIDLTELTFISSIGLRFLLEAQLRCAATERRLSIRPGSPVVQRLFEVTRTDAVLPFER